MPAFLQRQRGMGELPHTLAPHHPEFTMRSSSVTRIPSPAPLVVPGLVMTPNCPFPPPPCIRRSLSCSAPATAQLRVHSRSANASPRGVRYSISHIPPVAVATSPVAVPSGPPLRAVRNSPSSVHGNGGPLVSTGALAQRATAVLSSSCEGGARSPGCAAVTPPRQLSTTTGDVSSRRSLRAPSPERLRWALLAARRELDAWPSRELRQVVEEELVELQRSGHSLDHQMREQTNTRRLGSAILSALGLDGVSWPESVWQDMPQLHASNAFKPSQADVDSAMQLAHDVLERACTDLDAETAEQTRPGQLQRHASHNSALKPHVCQNLAHAINSPDGLASNGVRSATASKPQTPPGLHRRLTSRPAEVGKHLEGEKGASSRISKPFGLLEPRVQTHTIGACSSYTRVNGSHLSNCGGVRILSPGATPGEPRASDERNNSTMALASCAALSVRDVPDSAPLVYAPSVNTIRVVRPSPAEAHTFRLTPVAMGRPAEPCITPPPCSASCSSTHVAVSSTAPHLRSPSAALIDTAGPMPSGGSSLSFDEEFTRLKEDLAVERAERHALASRVEALLRLQQKTGSRRSSSPPSLPAATPEGTPTPPTADPSVASGSQADNISGGASAARLLHGREWSAGLDSACSTRLSGADAISAGMQAGEGNPQFDSGATPLHESTQQDLCDSRSRKGRDTERPTEPLQRVQDAMLADARAILAELEQDLACSGPASSKPDAAGPCASEELMRPLLPETADVPHVLSFYRRKCLELATQVQKRDTEVVNLRRALNEARSIGGGCN